MDKNPTEKPVKEISKEEMDGFLAVAKRIEAFHKTCKRLAPRDYVKRMQPYFLIIQAHRKKFGTAEEPMDAIQAVLEIVDSTMQNREIIWFYGTAAEILDNETKKVKTFDLIKPDGSPLF